MLKQRRPTLRALGRARQRGMVLLVALVVLVAIMIAGVAMMRSVDTTTLVTGNLALQQATTNAADLGIEQAVATLQDLKTKGLLDDPQPSYGYAALLQPTDTPAPGVSWQSFWESKNLSSIAKDWGEDSFGNHIWYLIQRECPTTGSPSVANCVQSPAITKASGNSEEAGEIELTAASQVYYRITVRVSGPKRTESYVQTHIAM